MPTNYHDQLLNDSQRLEKYWVNKEKDLPEKPTQTEKPTQIFCVEMYTHHRTKIEHAWVRAKNREEATYLCSNVVHNFTEVISCYESVEVRKLAISDRSTIYGINLRKTDIPAERNPMRIYSFEFVQ